MLDHAQISGELHQSLHLAAHFQHAVCGAVQQCDRRAGLFNRHHHGILRLGLAGHGKAAVIRAQLLRNLLRLLGDYIHRQIGVGYGDTNATLSGNGVVL